VKSEILLLRAYPTTDSSVTLLTNVKFPNNEVGINFLASKPEPGFYALELSITPRESSGNFATIRKTTRVIKVVSSISALDIELAVYDATDDIPTKRIR
jgi:hypothetical protein